MRLVSACICTFCALALLGGNAFARSAPWHKERSAASSPSSPWVSGVEVRHSRGHEVALIPAWQSEQAALGKEDTSGHIP